MPDFTNLPKQWLISTTPLTSPVAGKADYFSGLHLAAAEAVPILRLIGPDRHEIGRLIGWAIDRDYFHRADGTIVLAPGETAEALFARLGGRFVMLWRGVDGQLRLREDPAGGLPAIYVPAARLVGSTVTALDQLYKLPVDPEIEAIFDFPNRRGFLPFGLTPRDGAFRLMPSHELSLDNFTSARIWPKAPFVRIDPAAIVEHVAETAVILRAQVTAVLKQGETVLYLSAGHDSRIILASTHGAAGSLRAETLGESRSLEAHVAAQVAHHAGIPHRIVAVLPADASDVAAWLQRSGRMMYDPVSRLAPTAVANDSGTHPLTGTGVEIIRASNWSDEDAREPALDLTRLLARIRMPRHPAIERAGEAWLANLPPMDAAMALDLAKIEQIHGCWSGAAVYGHPLARPSLSAFSGRRLYEIALSMPVEYRLRNNFYGDLMTELWPNLKLIPVNRADGVVRLRFWREELRRLVPGRVKRLVKPVR